MTNAASGNPASSGLGRESQPRELVPQMCPTRGLGFVLGVFVASRVLVLLISVVGPYLLPPGTNSPGLAATTTWYDYWVRWDGGWYVDIAQNGYRFNAHGGNHVAFFPLLPLLMRAFAWLGLNAAAAGIAISNATFLAALWILYRFVREEFQRRRLAELATAFVAFGPAALWCSIGYTESLFLMLSVLLCWTLWSKRPAWGLACGVLAGLTRSNAITLALPALVLVWPSVRAAWRARDFPRLPLLWFAAFSPWIGYLLYAGYLQFAFGNWRANQLASVAGWGAELSFDPELLLTKLPGAGLRLFWSTDAFHEYRTWSWFAALAASIFAMVVFWETRAPRWHAAFVLGFWSFFLFAYQYGEPLSSMGRFTSVAFPLYVAAALFAERRPWAQPALLAVSVVGLTITTLFFFAGYHIN